MVVKNEQGYALITVLLIITIFTVVSLSYIGLASGSIKQNEVVEKKSQSVSIAEMGVTYYQTAIQGIFETILADRGLTPTSNFTPANITTIASQIETRFLSEFPKESEFPDTSAFNPIAGDFSTSPISITNLDFSTTPNVVEEKITINFKLKGTESGKDTVLEGEMGIDLNPLSPSFNSITPNCSSLPPGITHCEEVQNGGTPTSYNNMSNVKIISKGPLVFPNTSNNMTNIQILGSEVHFQSNVQMITNSTIESLGDMTVDGQLTGPNGGNPYINLDLFVGGNLYIDGKFELQSTKAQKVYVRDGVTVTNKMSIGSNYSVCIKGDLDVSNSLENFGNLYIQGNLRVPKSNAFTNTGVRYITGSVIYDDGTRANLNHTLPANSDTICGNTFDEPTIETVVDNVNYK
ncbi:hypothetical protein [Neobacillus niacini]|uniref:hypothetical protein n=1 Tax=Neobacillus niacini TaxID=86668 RepID=UPI0039837EDF